MHDTAIETFRIAHLDSPQADLRSLRQWAEAAADRALVPHTGLLHQSACSSELLPVEPILLHDLRACLPCMP